MIEKISAHVLLSLSFQKSHKLCIPGYFCDTAAGGFTTQMAITAEKDFLAPCLKWDPFLAIRWRDIVAMEVGLPGYSGSVSDQDNMNNETYR